MPFAAARYFDALHIPHAHIFSRSANPWIGVAVALTPLWFFLPYNLLLYGYLGNYHPVLFTFSMAMIAVEYVHITCCLRLPPDQVRKSCIAMMTVFPVIICFSLPWLGTLVLSAVPGGQRMPGGNLLAFSSILVVCIYCKAFNVRYSSSW